MAVVAVPAILKPLISEGLKIIFSPLKEKLRKYYKIKTISSSILKRVSKYIPNSNYDFEGYFEIILNSNSLTNVNNVKSVLKTRLFNKMDGHDIIEELKDKLKQDSYLSMELLKEKLTLTFFSDLFGDPKLNKKGNEKKKKVVESIWRAFNIEALKVIPTKDVVIEMYFDLTSSLSRDKKDIKEIKEARSYMRDYITTREVKGDNNEKRKLIYDKLWRLLVDLQIAADELWEHAIEERLTVFLSIYKEVSMEIKKEKYGIKEDHREKFSILIDQFGLYYDNKGLLIHLREGKVHEEEVRMGMKLERVIRHIIEKNRRIRKGYLKLLSEISSYFDEVLS